MTVTKAWEPTMTARTETRLDTASRIRRAEALRARVLRRWLGRGWLAWGWRRLVAAAGARRAEAELRALDERELRDLGLDRGGIVGAAQKGR
jgi:hypothetical protein